MSPYYSEDGITIYHGDCREILGNRDVFKGPSVAPAAIVTDPPYGMSMNPNGSRFSKGGHVWDPIEGDGERFDPSHLVDAAPKVIIWGFNHFPSSLPPGGSLVWVKRRVVAFGSFLSDAEIAWVKGSQGVYCFTDWTYQSESRWHPTQKPVSLMRWAIEQTKTEGLILDPYMGSGTTLIASRDLGRPAIGVEIEEKYCENAAKRLSQGVLDFGGSCGQG